MGGSETIDLQKLAPRIAMLSRQLSNVQLTTALRAGAIMAASDVRDRFSRGVSPEGVSWVPLAHPRPSGGNAQPLRDNGLLMASVYGRSDRNSVTVGTNLVYASLHQFGGVIRPVRAKWLTIPATREAKRAGGARRFPRDLHAIFGKRGGVLLDQTDTVQYYLAKEVTVPARPFLGFSTDWFLRMELLLLSEIEKSVTSVRIVR